MALFDLPGYVVRVMGVSNRLGKSYRAIGHTTLNCIYYLPRSCGGSNVLTGFVLTCFCCSARPLFFAMSARGEKTETVRTRRGLG